MDSRVLVATVGSCLSNRVAAYMPEAQRITSVYHNRSDQLVDLLVRGRRKLKSIEALSGQMHVEPGGVGEFTAYNLLLNQSAEGLGRHKLPHGIPFIEAIEKVSFDLILVDNFMDLVGRLYTVDGEDVFCSYPNGEAPEGFQLGERLTPQSAAENFNCLLRYLRKKQPRAMIVFLHFPVNNYKSLERKQWAIAFQDSLVVPASIDVQYLRKVTPALSRGREPQHFERKVYKRYAERIHSLMLMREKDRVKLRRADILGRFRAGAISAREVLQAFFG
ncbi:hypothetical protein D3C71_1100530 [compost metagenome]